jgi:hypothetical protein
MAGTMARHGDPLIVHMFLSSPGDVPEERAAARDLLKTEIEYHPRYSTRPATLSARRIASGASDAVRRRACSET